MAEKKSPKLVQKGKSRVDEIFEAAQSDIDDKVIEEAKKKVIVKMEELSKAKRVVANIEREIESLKLQIKQDLGEV